jgi:hypothetical protein
MRLNVSVAVHGLSASCPQTRGLGAPPVWGWTALAFWM